MDRQQPTGQAGKSHHVEEAARTVHHRPRKAAAEAVVTASHLLHKVEAVSHLLPKVVDRMVDSVAQHLRVQAAVAAIPPLRREAVHHAVEDNLEEA